MRHMPHQQCSCSTKLLRVTHTHHMPGWVGADAPPVTHVLIEQLHQNHCPRATMASYYIPQCTHHPQAWLHSRLLLPRALDPDAPIPPADSDPLVAAMLELHLEAMAPGAQQALQRAEQLLGTVKVEAAAAEAEGQAGAAPSAFAQHAGAVFQPGGAEGQPAEGAGAAAAVMAAEQVSS